MNAEKFCKTDYSDSVMKFMEVNVPVIKKGKTVQDVFLLLKKENKLLDSVDYIYVVGNDEKLLGVFSLKDAFKFSKSTRVEKVMQAKVISVSPGRDVEQIAHLALKHRIKSVPVVENGRLLGVVPAEEILHILNSSLRKDILHFAGIHKSHFEYENTMAVPVFKSIMHRIPWLLIGLVGIVLTAGFIGIFEKMLDKYLILAFFIPAVVYMSDALGTQVQILLIRDLAVMGKGLNQKSYLLKQMSISSLMAFFIGCIMSLVISIFWKQYYISFVIGLATFIALILTSFTAFMITVLIKRFGYDPALGGGPFATLVSDATSIIVYFLVATLLMGL